MDIGVVAIVPIVKEVCNRERILLINFPVSTHDEARCFSSATVL